ncbi:MAG: hypothetical protein CMK59_14610 [Proteobacteria bacterium]|nr:hypothetical protein [Pseudomonadota bacterium]
MSSIKLIFDVYKSGEFLGKQEFQDSAIIIGNSQSAQLRLDSAEIMPSHAVFNVLEQKITLVDLSTRGIIVNGETISSSTEVQHNDEIEIAEYKLTLKLQDSGFEDEEITNADNESPLPKVSAPKPSTKNETTSNQNTSNQKGEPSAFLGKLLEKHEAERSSEASVLEISQVRYLDLGGNIHDVKYFRPNNQKVKLGNGKKYRLAFIGEQIAWVPSAYAKFGWLMFPFTESNEVWDSDFYEHNTPTFDFVEWKEGTAHCSVPSDWDFFVQNGENRTSKQQMLASEASETGSLIQFPVNKDGSVVIESEYGYYILRMVPQSSKVVTSLAKEIDYPFWTILLLMSSIFGALSFYVYNAEPPPQTSIEEMGERFADLLLEEPPEPPKEDKKDANPDAGEGAKAKKEEGKVGKKDSKMKEAKGDKVEISQKQKDKEIVENAGIMGALADAGNLDGVGGLSGLDANLSGGIGGVLGAKGVQFGSGGLGSRGSGLGGGGSADGLGGLGNKGTGRGSSGYGTGGGSYGKKKKGGIGKIGGTPVILGALDKSLIDAVIKRNMNQIRYCYQRELTKNPSLGGKIVIKFFIAKDGSVSRAEVKSSSMGSKVVESCITGRFRRFKFPEPKGGGIVIVSYPFLFSPG